ncbi:hypothetical protein ABET17_11645, partial [Heyndrickxia faecalis]
MSKLIFEGFKKRPKRESESERIVLLESSKRQKRAGIRSNCPFEGFKRTKEKLEFSRTVLLEGSKGQKKAGIQSNCSFGCLKKTKESQTRGQLSFWRV